VFYCPGPRPPRGGTSLEKLLPLIHPLDDHLAVHVALLNRVNAWAMATRTLTYTEYRNYHKAQDHFRLK